ncbi:MAG: DUF423 domain-containing protein [Kiloniellales bacterium]
MAGKRAWVWILLGALSAGAAVALGAIGVHVAAEGSQEQAWMQTAQRYQMPHALGLVIIGAIALQRPGRLADLAGLALVLGSLCFSGGLYLQAFSIVNLGAVVPVGGTLLILGWLALAGHAIRALSAQGPGVS